MRWDLPSLGWPSRRRHAGTDSPLQAPKHGRVDMLLGSLVRLLMGDVSGCSRDGTRGRGRWGYERGKLRRYSRSSDGAEGGLWSTEGTGTGGGEKTLGLSLGKLGGGSGIADAWGVWWVLAAEILRAVGTVAVRADGLVGLTVGDAEGSVKELIIVLVDWVMIF